MLDILRKHASSWLIKVILGAIIISFAFFFGYNRMTRAKRGLQGLGTGEAVATVNGVDISAAEYRFFHERNLERLKENIKGEGMDESLRKIVQSMTLQQLIQRQLLLQTAEKLGVRIPDAELAFVIRRNPELIRDGEFDPIFYRHQYLPYFENRFGINYEELVRQDLAIDALKSIFTDIDVTPASENEVMKWTFEVVSIQPKKLVEEKKVKDEAEAKKVAEEFAAHPRDWKKLAQKSHVDVKTVGPLTIAQRSQILEGRGALQDYQKIFTLNESRPVSSMELGDAIYIVKFVGKKTETAQAIQERQGDFLSNWLGHQVKTAKIQTYLEAE